MSRKTISSQNPPILWDTVDQAFKAINDNFTELYLSIGGGSPVDLTALSTDLIPETNSIYDLGSETRRWRDLYLSGSSLYLGNAVVTSSGRAVNLPEGSTVGGALIRNPVESSFKTITVTGQSDVVANSYTGTLRFAGSGISIVTDANNDIVTFNNSGVTEAVAGSGISVNRSTGSVIFSNSGVLTTVAGAGIGVSGASGNVTISNTGVRQLIAGGGIILDATTGVVTITNSAPNITQNLWRFISVGSTVLDPTGPSSTLSFAPDTGIALNANIVNNTLTFTNTGVTSLAGGTGISVSGSTGSVNITNTGVTSLVAGSGMSVDVSTGTVTVSNTRYGFTSIAVTGQNPCLADNTTDTVTFVGGTGISLTTDDSTDTITVASTLTGLPSQSSHNGQFLSTNGTLASWTALSTINVSTFINDSGYLTSNGIPSQTGNPGKFLTTSGSALSWSSISQVPSQVGQGGRYLTTDGTQAFWTPIVGVGGSSGGTFDLTVAADDSTLRSISSGEVIKFVGAGGITTASDTEGQITITYGGTPLQTRGNVFNTTGVLGNNGTTNLTIAGGFRTYVLYKIQTSVAAWVRVYTDTAARTADSSRSQSVDPTPGSGVIAEVITTGSQVVLLSPGVIGFSNEGSPSTNIELAVTNLSGGSSAVTVTLTLLRLEV